MQAKWHGGLALYAGALLFAAGVMIASPAHASTDIVRHNHSTNSKHTSSQTVAHSDIKHPLSKSGKAHYAGGGRIQCVTFARAATGISLKGNAANWWDAAAGVYERGNRPEAGSVLNFRANGHMRLGHVAVVSNVIGPREIEIDHANWAVSGYTKGNVTRGMRVIDVSDRNDWTQVRVELGHTETFGSVYPAYGFIYDRPDTGRMVANTPSNTQPLVSRAVLNFDEVAEAPAVQSVRASVPVDAPDHSLR